jgi:hypothetical protein
LAKLEWGKVQLRRQSLWLNPDGFTAGLARYLSGHALEGERSFGRIYPDFLDRIYFAHASPWAASRTTVPPDSLRVEGVWDLPPEALHARQTVKDLGQQGRSVQLKPDPEPAAPGRRRIVVRARIDSEAADKDGVYRFVTNQFRLLAWESTGESTVECFPIGINYPYARRWVRIYAGQPFARQAASGLEVDLVFEIPDPGKPWFLEYKLNARADVPTVQEEVAPRALAPSREQEKQGASDRGNGDQPRQRQRDQRPPANGQQGREGSPSGRSEREDRPRDRVSGVRATEEGSLFSDLLPFELTAYRTEGGFSIAGDTVVGGTGRLVAPFTDEGVPEQGNQSAVRTFDVPEGQRLLQLRVNELQPQSWLGNVLGHVTRTVQRYYMVDAQGGRHLAVGAYAIANTGDGRLMELVYFDETARAADKPPKFAYIRHDDLARDYALYFLFHVPPGTRVEGFDTGRREEDLSGLGLVAPR